MDLVPLDLFAEGGADGPGEGLLAGEPHPYGQESRALRHGPPATLDVVLDVLAENLEAAADAEHGPPLGRAARDGVREPALTQPRQRLHGAPRPGHDDEVRVGQFLRPVHEPHHDARFGGERVDVGEVGHQRDRAHGDPQHVLPDGRGDVRLPDRAAQGDPQPVLLVDAEPVPEGQHPVRRPSGEPEQHVEPGLQQADTSPRNLLTRNPATSAWSSGDSRATVPKKEAKTPPRSMSPTTSTGSRGIARDPHVHDVGPPQVDLGRAARPPHRSPRHTCPAVRRGTPARSREAAAAARRGSRAHSSRPRASP